MKKKLQHIQRDFGQWSLLTATIGIFVAIPLLAIVLNLGGGYGEEWEHVRTYYLPEYIRHSIYLIFGTGILCFSFGTAAAWLVTQYDFPFRKKLEWLCFLPLAIPSYITAYAYVGIFGNGGTLIRLGELVGLDIYQINFMNIYGLIWILSLSLFPYVYASARAIFTYQSRNIRDAAFILGASQRRYFFTIALPLATPAIIGGLFLVFMEVLNDYGAAKYYNVKTFTTGIFKTWTELEDLKSAIYLAAILVVIVFGITAFVKWLRGRRSYVLPTSSKANHQRISLKGWKRLAAFSIVGFPVLFGFVLPIFQLLYWSVLTFDKMLNIELFWIAAQSFGISALAAILVVVFALMLVYFNRWNNLKGFSFFPKIATIGYVIPGAIIGIGIISSRQVIVDFFYNSLDLKIGFLIYGSILILIYAYIFRFLAVAYNPIEANSLKIGKNLSESSYLLGEKRLRTLFHIELPLLKTTLISALLLVFIDTLKELPLTLILKPYDIQTLAIEAYNYADDEQVAMAALPALVLVIIVSIVMWLVNFLSKKQIKTN